jgi:hypothetical protein
VKGFILISRKGVWISVRVVMLGVVLRLRERRALSRPPFFALLLFCAKGGMLTVVKGGRYFASIPRRRSDIKS